MTEPTARPWKIIFSNVWPWKFRIEDMKGNHIVKFDRVACSTDQRTIADVRNAVGFNEKEKTKFIVLEQEANATHIVKCVNNHDDLVKALKNIENGMIPKMTPLDDILEFRTKMWSWSQERAKQALLKAGEEEA